MKVKLVTCFLLFFLVFSCKNDSEIRVLETKREAKKNEQLFKTINKGWVFYDKPITAAAEASLGTWTEFRLFLAELRQKPKKTIGAFQQKTKALTQKAVALNYNIPIVFNQPQVQIRIATLISKVQMLDLYMNLRTIPDKKVVQLVGEINIQLVSLERKMDQIVEKSKIPIEEGESDIIKMKDTSRAIPTPTNSAVLSPL